MHDQQHSDDNQPCRVDRMAGEEFVRLFAADRERLFAYILALMHDRADAEEVFQETSLILWREFETYRRDAPFLPWACGVALNQMRKFWRNRKRDKHTFSMALLEDLSKDAAAMQGEFDVRKRALATCLQKLRAEDRRIVELYYGSKVNAQAVADEVDKSIHTVYKALQRVRLALFECINRQVAVQMREQGG